jgi:hypothetical protein
MARTSRIQWRALSRRTVVIRSLACAAGAAASLALPPRWLRRRSNIRTHQRAINSAATALCSRSRTPARWSTVKSVRRAGVNSGSKRPAEPRWFPQPQAKRRGTPVVTASLGSHAPQSRRRINNFEVSTRSFQDSRQKTIDLRQGRPVRKGAYSQSARKRRVVLTEPISS